MLVEEYKEVISYNSNKVQKLTEHRDETDGHYQCYLLLINLDRESQGFSFFIVT